MGGDASDYATLGLEPGADRAAIEGAYRQLIKHHHPDRAGGDAVRAAEITRAYRELREQWLGPNGLEFHEQAARAPTRFGAAWLMIVLVIAGASLALLFRLDPQSPLVEQGLVETARALLPDQPRPAGEPMEEPIDEAAVAAAVADARRIARGGDEMALTSESRACHGDFRVDPRLSQLDRCAAFDDAVVIIQDRDPMRDRGAFGELAVTGRQWSAAKGLSGDYVAIDGRLDQIRLRVELLLAASAPAER